jgi:hypothetical protein
MRLERINLLVRESMLAVRRGAVGASFLTASRALTMLLTHPRAILSMMEPHTWRVISMGQVLRARAARARDRADAARAELVTEHDFA